MTESDCLFCKIIADEIPADIIHESPDAIAFRDINPQAPTHVLIVPRRDTDAVGQLFLAARNIARQEGFAEDGYRVTMNCNAAAGQTVFHIHLHLLGGRNFTWPPG